MACNPFLTYNSAHLQLAWRNAWKTGRNWNISTNIEWTDMTFCAIHVPQMMMNLVIPWCFIKRHQQDKVYSYPLWYLHICYSTWIGTKCGLNIHGSKMMYPNNSGDPLTFPVARPAAWTLFKTLSSISSPLLFQTYLLTEFSFLKHVCFMSF